MQLSSHKLGAEDGGLLHTLMVENEGASLRKISAKSTSSRLSGPTTGPNLGGEKPSST